MTYECKGSLKIWIILQSEHLFLPTALRERTGSCLHAFPIHAAGPCSCAPCIRIHVARSQPLMNTQNKCLIHQQDVKKFRLYTLFSYASVSLSLLQRHTCKLAKTRTTFSLVVFVVFIQNMLLWNDQSCIDLGIHPIIEHSQNK